MTTPTAATRGFAILRGDVTTPPAPPRRPNGSATTRPGPGVLHPVGDRQPGGYGPGHLDRGSAARSRTPSAVARSCSPPKPAAWMNCPTAAHLRARHRHDEDMAGWHGLTRPVPRRGWRSSSRCCGACGGCTRAGAARRPVLPRRRDPDAEMTPPPRTGIPVYTAGVNTRMVQVAGRSATVSSAIRCSAPATTTTCPPGDRRGAAKTGREAKDARSPGW